jgi:hypothetical protein
MLNLVIIIQKTYATHLELLILTSFYNSVVY